MNESCPQLVETNAKGRGHILSPPRGGGIQSHFDFFWLGLGSRVKGLGSRVKGLGSRVKYFSIKIYEISSSGTPSDPVLVQ